MLMVNQYLLEDRGTSECGVQTHSTADSSPSPE